MRSKISFLIASFNTKKYTEWSYNSIRKNLSNAHEIVMLDDGSTDGTWKLLQNLKRKDKNITIHKNKENIGIAYSFNKMVELSQTKYFVCFIRICMCRQSLMQFF